MPMRMLIDARHPEETRVAVLNGNRIEEFDFESAEHKQIKGNIYLAKVTRVEPSLQAAFVDFGGNRHGFLAFSEIHPDYYQIPADDRAALIAEELAHAEEEAALREQEEGDTDFDDGAGRDDDGAVEEVDTSQTDDVSTIEDGHLEAGSSADGDDQDDGEDDDTGENDGDEDTSDTGRSSGGRGNRRGRGRRQGGGSSEGSGGTRSRAKEIDELRAKRQALRRRYKIQDVIQRRQVLLVQVVKEERGNKGAALTTYLSLAGRYCVLMPNSSNGGGISRKIANGADRKRLKQVVSELTLPRSMGLIVRTAGLERTKTEIKRDFDYLARLWDGIRENTLSSSAPAMIHSDSDLVKRAIRDIYNRDIEEVVVEGEEGFKAARQFMKLLMPSHARRVKAYSDPVPLFQRYGAEDQLSAMYDPVVQLKSGGYLVINPTEALVSIDINSGRSTKEHGIEQTALSTNLEAAREIARQLRLRDMAGLVVIDFIDMENNSSIRKVEKAMKDALKNDRARIQVGRISGFGLMEMSRQRLRTGVLEASTRSCPHCDGTGLVRTASSAGLAALRLIEDEAAKGKGSIITLFASQEAAIYLLNAKRADLAEIEARYHVSVEVVPEGEDEGAKMRIQSSGPRPTEVPSFTPIVTDDDEFSIEDEDEDDAADEEDTLDTEDASDRSEESDRGSHAQDDEDDGQRKKRRRRRRGGRGRNRNRDQDDTDAQEQDDADEDDQTSEDTGAGSDSEPDTEESQERAPRSRRRRSGRRRSQTDEGNADEAAGTSDQGKADVAEAQYTQAVDMDAQAAGDEPVEAELPEPTESKKPARRSPRRKKAADVDGPDGKATEEPGSETLAEDAPAKPKTRRRKAAKPAPAEEADDTAETVAAPAGDTDDSAQDAEPAEKPKRATRRRTKASESTPAQTVIEVTDRADDTRPEETETVSAPASEGDAGQDEAQSAAAEDDGTPRRGWWQRTFGA